jgi:hypothetical protein
MPALVGYSVKCGIREADSRFYCLPLLLKPIKKVSKHPLISVEGISCKINRSRASKSQPAPELILAKHFIL